MFNIYATLKKFGGGVINYYLFHFCISEVFVCYVSTSLLWRCDIGFILVEKLVKTWIVQKSIYIYFSVQERNPDDWFCMYFDNDNDHDLFYCCYFFSFRYYISFSSSSSIADVLDRHVFFIIYRLNPTLSLII